MLQFAPCLVDHSVLSRTTYKVTGSRFQKRFPHWLFRIYNLKFSTFFSDYSSVHSVRTRVDFRRNWKLSTWDMGHFSKLSEGMNGVHEITIRARMPAVLRRPRLKASCRTSDHFTLDKRILQKDNWRFGCKKRLARSGASGNLSITSFMWENYWFRKKVCWNVVGSLW